MGRDLDASPFKSEPHGIRATIYNPGQHGLGLQSKQTVKGTSWKQLTQGEMETLTNMIPTKRSLILVGELRHLWMSKKPSKDNKDGDFFNQLITVEVRSHPCRSLNCRGLGNPLTICGLHRLVKQMHPQVQIFMETRLNEKVIKHI